jgi:hypothetical protein
MATPKPMARAPRSGGVPVCAICLALLGGVALAACLNPMPEEFPSDRDAPPSNPVPNDALGVGTPGTDNAMSNGGAAAGGPGGQSGTNGSSPEPSAPPPSTDPGEGLPAGVQDAGVDAAPPSDTVTDATP